MLTDWIRPMAETDTTFTLTVDKVSQTGTTSRTVLSGQSALATVQGWYRTGLLRGTRVSAGSRTQLTIGTTTWGFTPNMTLDSSTTSGLRILTADGRPCPCQKGRH